MNNLCGQAHLQGDKTDANTPRRRGFQPRLPTEMHLRKSLGALI